MKAYSTRTLINLLDIVILIYVCGGVELSSRSTRKMMVVKKVCLTSMTMEKGDNQRKHFFLLTLTTVETGWTPSNVLVHAF